ncbi:MAG: hypothetical protein Q9215_004040 [Flavoplaca cf. flavocitrina]
MAPEVASRSPKNSAADMWSLGVVFLEMVTVLQGSSISQMRKFIANHGTRQPCVFSNEPATTQWFEELRLNGRGPIFDNEPLSWIKDLTQSEPQRRPKPWALTSQIRSSISSTAFIGICCADEDEIHDYPSPPSTANSDGDAPLQEQLEALGFFKKPYGSFMQPQKQRSLTERRDNVLSDTVSPYTMALWEGSVFDEPSKTSEDDVPGVSLTQSLIYYKYSTTQLPVWGPSLLGQQLEKTISLGLKSAQSLTWAQQQETTQSLRAVLDTKLPKTIQTMRRTSNKIDEITEDSSGSERTNTSHWQTPLHFAMENPSFRGYTNVIRILLERGADADALDQNKKSPLLQILYGGYKALEKHKRDALACLLQDHIDVDVNVRPLGTLDMPIHLAVRRRDAIAVAILIHRRSRVNDLNSSGLTPLRMAASSWSETSPEDDMEILKYLLLGGASITEAAGASQSIVLEMAARQGCVQAVNLLLSKADGPQVPQMCQAAVEAATVNKSKMSETAYSAIRQALELAQVRK